MKAPKTATPKAVTPKSVTSKSAAPINPPSPEPEIRILKVASCPSLSGKSTLTYHVGCTPESDIQFRVYANSGTGFFSKEWVLLSTIQQAFAKVPVGKAITSFILFPLYRGKSINTPAFLFAALMNEGLVEASISERRGYDRVAADAFMAEVKALMASGISLRDDDKPSKAKAVKVADKPEKADGKGQNIEPQKQQGADKPQKVKPAKVEAEVKTEKAPEKPSKPEVKPKLAKVQAKPAKEATASSKKAASKAPQKKGCPR